MHIPSLITLFSCMQELARVMPPIECAAMLERFMSCLDMPGVQGQVLYIVRKRIEADAHQHAVADMHAREDPADLSHTPQAPPDGGLWASTQVADMVLAPLFRAIKLTRAKKQGILETNVEMSVQAAGNLLEQREVLMECMALLTYLLQRAKGASLPPGFQQQVAAWLSQHQQPVDPGLSVLTQCLLDRVAAAEAAFKKAGKEGTGAYESGLQLVSFTASRLLEVLTQTEE